MKPNWHDTAFFGLHFDLHATEKDTDLGKDLTVDDLVEQLNKVRPDFVQCDCKGHPGYASYPTKIGAAAPGIVQDALRIWRETARQLGIPLIVHYSGVWDTAALERHPEWGRVNSPKIGTEVWPKPEVNPLGREKNMTCPLSDYTDRYMIPQMLEIIEQYDIDGFWVDGENWASTPCYCEKCTALYKQQTGRSTVPEAEGEDGWQEWLAFSRRNFEEHVRRYTEAIHRRKPGCTVCSNWMYTFRQPDDCSVPVDYISGDLSWVWSCASAGVEARVMDGRDIGWDLMAWGFSSHGPMKDWTFKTTPALCQEAAAVMSCGGAFMVYDTPDRGGNLIGWHMDELAEVAGFCRARQEYCQDTVSVPQIAVLHAAEHMYAHNNPLYNLGEGGRQVEGALYALLENNLHIDIRTGTDFLQNASRYPLWVVPEQEHLDQTVVDALKEYVRNGGALIVTGAEQTRRFDDVLGITDGGCCAGEGYQEPVYLPVGKRTVCGMGTWRMVTLTDAHEITPVLHSRDLGKYMRKSGYSAATVRPYGSGVIAGIYGPVFGSYAISHYPLVRQFIKDVVQRLDLPQLMRVEAPAHVQVTLRRKDSRLFVNLVNLGCENPLSPTRTLVENVPPAGPVKISLFLDAAPKSVSLVPGFIPVSWEFSGGCVQVYIEKIGIHDILVIEKPVA